VPNRILRAIGTLLISVCAALLILAVLEFAGQTAIRIYQGRLIEEDHAQYGYVSTQEVIALWLEVQRGNVPHVVIFYDGLNDVFAAFQSGVAGIPQNEFNRAAEFNLLRLGSFRSVLWENLALYKLGERASAYLRRGDAPNRGPVRASGVEPLAAAIVDAYIHNTEAVEALASRSGSKAFFFWQPTLYTKTTLSQAEREESARPRTSQLARSHGA